MTNKHNNKAAEVEIAEGVKLAKGYVRRDFIHGESSYKVGEIISLPEEDIDYLSNLKVINKMED